MSNRLLRKNKWSILIHIFVYKKLKKNKNITAYSIQDFSQCQHKTWLDFLEPPKDFSKNYAPWLEIIRKIGIEHEKNYLD